MSVIQDSEYVLFKSVSQHIKSGLTRPLSFLNKKCLRELEKFEKQRELFLNCETYEDLGDNSKKFKTEKDRLVSLLAVQDRLEKILKRNEQRIEFVSTKLEQMGIYNDKVDKKSFSEAISKESKNVSSASLNLNPNENGGVILKYFAGEILAFRDNKLDFSLEENSDILLNGSSDFFHEVISIFPYSVSTIPDEYFLESNLKNKILKECILYVASKIKTQSIYESNKQLGGLLENTGRITDFWMFAKELKNYFNVVAKQCLKSQAPELAGDADSALRCNEMSEFLPSSKRVYGSADNLSDDLDETEEQESKEQKGEEQLSEVKEESENETEQDSEKQSDLSKEKLLDMLLSDEDDLDLKESQKEENLEMETEGDEVDSDIEKTLKELAELFTENKDDEDE